MSEKNSIPLITLFIVIILVNLHLYGQRRRTNFDQSDIEALDKQQKNIEREVKKTEEYLEETRKIKKKSFTELSLLRTQIELREQLLGSLSQQIFKIDQEIARIEAMSISMDLDVKRYQKSYAAISYVAYKTQDKLSTLLWIFSSNSFVQAFERLMYFREFSKYRKNQIFLIKRTRAYLERKRAEKEKRKQEKEILMGRRVEEKNKLDATKKEKDLLYRDLKITETQHEIRIKKYKKELAQIREQIRLLVLESKKEASKERLEEFEKLSSNFNNNRGKLPWPVPMNEGVITGQFGKNQTNTGTEIINDGIYISTKPGQSIRSIFNGTVTMISKVPMYGKVVIIQHGKYRTVYANLEEVFVNKGDEVSTLQNIGNIKTNLATGETQLYFQIYRDFNPINPISWLVAKD